MDYSTISYKVEDGVIVNATVVEPNAPTEEGFVKRDYPLRMGDVEKLGDFYPSSTTQEEINFEKQLLIRKVESIILEQQETSQKITAKITKLESDISKLLPEDENLPSLNEQKEEEQQKLEKTNVYIDYLNAFKADIRNPIYQRPKTIEEI